jgi:hypothetical protein
MTRLGRARRPVAVSARLAARAVGLAVDPAVDPTDIAHELGRVAGVSPASLELASRRLVDRDPDGRSSVGVRALTALRIALGQRTDERAADVFRSEMWWPAGPGASPAGGDA